MVKHPLDHKESNTTSHTHTHKTQTINNIRDHFLNKIELLRIKSSKTTITLDLRGLPQNFKFFYYILNKRLFQQVEKKKDYPTVSTVPGIRNFMIKKIQMLVVSYFS